MLNDVDIGRGGRRSPRVECTPPPRLGASVAMSGGPSLQGRPAGGSAYARPECRTPCRSPTPTPDVVLHFLHSPRFLSSYSTRKAFLVRDDPDDTLFQLALVEGRGPRKAGRSLADPRSTATCVMPRSAACPEEIHALLSAHTFPTTPTTAADEEADTLSDGGGEGGERHDACQRRAVLTSGRPTRPAR